MTTIEPGTQVCVVIKGEVRIVVRSDLDPELIVRSHGGNRFSLSPRDFAVTVTPVDPERPTLEQLLADHEYLAKSFEPTPPACRCGEAFPTQDYGPGSRVLHRRHLAEVIEAAHPEWTP